MSPEEMNDLVDAHGAGVYRFCLKLTGSRQEAEELFQQTFLRALELRSRIDPARNPLGFLLAVAAKAHRRTAAKAGRRGRILPQADRADGEDPVEGAAGPLTVEQSAEARELRRAVLSAVRTLPERLRTPVLLHYTADLAVEEIAGAMGIRPGTVKSRLHRARQRIRKELEAKGYEKEYIG